MLWIFILSLVNGFRFIEFQRFLRHRPPPKLCYFSFELNSSWSGLRTTPPGGWSEWVAWLGIICVLCEDANEKPFMSLLQCWTVIWTVAYLHVPTIITMQNVVCVCVASERRWVTNLCIWLFDVYYYVERQYGNCFYDTKNSLNSGKKRHKWKTAAQHTMKAIFLANP